MNTVLRAVAGILAGMFVAIVLLVAVELLSAVLHPVPADFGGTMEEMCEHVARYPAWVLAVVVPAWGFTAMASTWIARRIGGRGPAIVVGLLLLAALVSNLWNLPYPAWFKLATLLVIPAGSVFGLFGGRLLVRPNAMDVNDAS